MQLSGSPGWLGTARVERLIEEPGRPDRVWIRPQRLEGMNNLSCDPGRGSERPIVAKKRGNSRGAKGPCWKHVCAGMNERPFVFRHNYGRTGGLLSDHRGWNQAPGEIVLSEAKTLLKGQSIEIYREMKSKIKVWLQQNNIAYYMPPALPSRWYVDASHPMSEGYAALAKQLFENESFRSSILYSN